MTGDAALSRPLLLASQLTGDSPARGGLDRSVVYVGYTGETPKEHAKLVSPGLVGGLLEHGLDDEPETLKAVAAIRLEMIRNQHPANGDDLRGWKASALRPIQQLEAA